MLDRELLKGRAKDIIRKCLLASIVVCLISGFLAGEFTHGSITRNFNSERNPLEFMKDSVDTAVSFVDGNSDRGVIRGIVSTIIATLLSGIGIALFLVGILISIIIGAPILIGSKRFFMSSRKRDTQIGTVLYGFRSGQVVNIIITMLLVRVKTYLWSLLFVIPGIIKSYEYRMVPYLLSENPRMIQSRAFELSREMMYGKKWEVFVLDLSFILWNLLGALTCGLGNVLFVNPYIAATNAELYAQLREEAFQRGVTNYNELPGF